MYYNLNVREYIENKTYHLTQRIYVKKSYIGEKPSLPRTMREKSTM